MKMKTMKFFTLGLLFAGAVAMTGCKKEDMSQYAKKEEIKQTTIKNIDLTITPNQWIWNAAYKSWEFSYPHGYIGNGVLVGYVMGGQGMQSLPYYDANSGVIYGLADRTYLDEIKITYYDGTSSLAKPSYDKHVYLKIIPSALRKAHVDYSDFEAVAKAHNF
jgi:hypothetical protein